MPSLKIEPNVKPLGAFVEYTLKPLLDESRELIELLEKHGIEVRGLLPHAVRLYLIDSLIRCFTALACTGMICFAVYLCLHTKP